MLKKLLFCFLFFAGSLTPVSISFADSPLTSTPFHEAYLNIDEVLKAEQTGELSGELAEFLHSRLNSIDKKAAVINAFGWDINVKGNAEKYCIKIFGKSLTEIDINDTAAEDLFVIGYLNAMENYHNPEKSFVFLKESLKQLKSSFTARMIYALVRSQIAMNTDFCKVWKYSDKIFSNKELNSDMTQSGVKIIYDYMVLYKDYCK